MRTLLIPLAVILAAIVSGCPQPMSSAKTPPASVNQPPPGAGVKAPVNYHILEDQGGVPLSEAMRSNLKGSGYAYLRSLVPAQMSDGVDMNNSATVRTHRYEIGYKFETRDVEKQYLEFSLQDAWDELHFGFGFDDNSPSDPEGKLKIELTVLVDGNPAYVSSQISPNDEPVFTSVNVRGARRVIFEVRRIGYNNLFTPLLLDPFLLKLDTPQAK